MVSNKFPKGRDVILLTTELNDEHRTGLSTGLVIFLGSLIKCL